MHEFGRDAIAPHGAIVHSCAGRVILGMSNEQESLAWRFCVAPMMDWYENLELARLSTLSRAPCAMHRTFF
jgi:hypothetical protein